VQQLVVGRKGLRPLQEPAAERKDQQKIAAQERQRKLAQLLGQQRTQEPEHRILEWEAQQTVK
jgi:hypothetical protein